MEEELAHMNRENTHIVLAAIENGQLAGAVMGIVCRELYGQCRPFLLVENMVVDAGCRRQGVGTRLLFALEKEAESRGCAQMLLVTEAERQDACAFYENYGFQKNNKGYKKKIYLPSL